MPLSEVTDALQVFLGLAVRQRLRLQQPRVSRLRPGRSAVPQRSQGPGAVLRARAQRGDGAAVEPRARARDDGAAGHQPLQPVSIGRDQRRGGARLQLGSGAAGDAGAGRPDAAAGHVVRLGRAIARGDQGRHAVGGDLRPGPGARLPDAGGAVRELSAAVHHPARRAAGRARRGRAHRDCAG